MFRRRISPWVGKITVQKQPEEDQPMYDEYDPMPQVVKKKKSKYLPGEKLLRKLHKQEKARSNNLDLSIIQRSINDIINDLADSEP